MHLSVEKAEGEYCWLFSSDDIMRPGAINKVLTEIKDDLDVYLCNFTICELDCKTPMIEHYVLKGENQNVYNLSDTAIRAQYFSVATETTAFFSFMGSLIIKRARWLNTNIEEHFFGTCWAHAVRILRMIPQGLVVKYIPFSLLLKRAYNDSFLDKGIVHRFSIAIDGYPNIMRLIFGEQSIEAFHIARVLRAEFTMRVFLATKLALKGRGEKKKLFDLYKKLYLDYPVKIHLMNLLLAIPNPLIASLRILYQNTRPLRNCLKNFVSARISQ
jgi:abequosyltransferase